MFTTIKPNEMTTVTNEETERTFTVSTVIRFPDRKLTTVAFEDNLPAPLDVVIEFENANHAAAVQYLETEDVPVGESSKVDLHNVRVG